MFELFFVKMKFFKTFQKKIFHFNLYIQFRNEQIPIGILKPYYKHRC